MANNKIQIKRSATNSTVPSLANGELAYTGNGDILYIGHPDGTSGNIRIAGKQTPGTLTANQALVANSTSGIDKLITANLTLSSFSVSTINAFANLTHLGAASNSELTTTWAIKTFVDDKIASASNPQGSNGQFQYNNSGVLAGTDNMVYDNVTKQVTIGNSTVNVQLGYTGSVNALTHFHGNQNSYVQVILNNINAGNAASSDYIAENNLGTETTNFVDLGINSSTYADPNFSAMGAGDAYLYSANNDLVIGTADSGGGELRFITGGTTTSQIRATVTVGGNVGIGNTTPNARLQVTGTANISGLTTVSANLVLGAGLTANGSGGSAGHVLKSGGSGNVYWDATTATVAGSDTQVQYNDGGALAGAVGFTYSKTTNNVAIANTLHIPANNAFGNATTGGSLANSTTFAVGNSTINSIHTAALLQVSNSTTIANVTAAGLIVYTNSTVNATHSSTLLQVANPISVANVTATGLQVYTNSTVNSTVTASLVQVSNSTGIANLNAISLILGGTVVNTSIVSVGANVYANATTVFTGNSTVNASVISSLVQVSNSTSTANLSAADLKIGATTVVNSSQITATLFSGSLTGSYANISGQVNTATLYAATSANIASAVQANSTGIWTTGTANAANFTAGAGYGAASVGAVVNSGTIGISSNTTVNTSITSSQIQVANSTSIANLNATSLTIGTSVVNSTAFAAGANVLANTTVFRVGNTTISTTNAIFGGTIAANGGVGSAGQALISGGAANAYWSTIGNGTVTSVASGNGITGGTITTSGTLYVTEGVGLAVNTTGVHVKANSGIIANSTGTFVAANTTGGLLANSTLQVKIGTGLVFDGSGNVAVNAASLSFTDLTVSGNLTVLGDLVSLNVATLAVEDPLIVLAKDQSNTTTYTDAVDIGFFGSYGNTLTKNWSGLFRDQSDSGIYKLFSGNIPEPTTTVDTTNVNFSYATLQTYLRTGGAGATGLISNATHIAITANSTLNVAIAANTLTLTTPLATTSGGTGLNSFAVGDLLVGNSSNALTRLSSGADGYVLQINGTGVVAWNTLDGGTF